jgi:hypothetical protein
MLYPCWKHNSPMHNKTLMQLKNQYFDSTMPRAWYTIIFCQTFKFSKQLRHYTLFRRPQMTSKTWQNYRITGTKVTVKTTRLWNCTINAENKTQTSHIMECEYISISSTDPLHRNAVTSLLNFSGTCSNTCGCGLASHHLLHTMQMWERETVGAIAFQYYKI